ncbi:MAG: ThiF family adenylyltransferase [Candidatus Paceibacterota bacterium]|jgi:molybdopterin/thiamine biosynthesis adenylyltransferase/proteasome lid subunit RPN8/RPN11
MEYSISFKEEDYQRLVEHLFSNRTTECAAYLLCGVSRSDTEIRLLVRSVIPVEDADIEESSPVHMKIRSLSYVRAIKQARKAGEGFIFVHSHPKESPQHSKQDDIEEEKLFKTVYQRIPDMIHASLVLSEPSRFSARVWLDDGSNIPVSVVRSIGHRFRFFSNHEDKNPHPEFFDRQIKAFGKDIQSTLNKLKIGIVGLGGTGSAVAEQLIRLGVGTLYLFDDDTFDSTNINRVYGSRLSDTKKLKVEIIQRLATEIGLGTIVKIFNKKITYQSVLQDLKKCDIVFGCTDDNWGRSILSRLAVYYLIPVIDMGVKINSKNNEIVSIHGRVTVLLPDHACLFCRDRIDSGIMSTEIAEATNPSDAATRKKEGYIPELPDSAPAVIPFTTIVAATSVSELLHRLTGFLGEDRKTNEVIHLFDQERIGKNARASENGCVCGDKNHIARGDVDPHALGLTWRNED